MSRSTERERLHQRRQRLHRGADDDLLAVRDAALDAAGAVRLAVQAALVADDLVVRLRAAEPGEREAVADLDALHRLDPHQRRREPRVEPVLAPRVRAEARRDAARPHLDAAAERVAILPRRVDGGGIRPRLGQRLARDLDPDLARSAFATAPAATWTAVCRAEARSSASRTSASPCFCTPARSACPGRGSVTGFVPFPSRLALGRPRAHPPRPVLVVAVADDERERRAERAAVAEAREHLDLVGLDLLARRAAVALLAAAQVGVDRRPVEDEARRQARDDRDERRPVRLSRRCELERHARRA